MLDTINAQICMVLRHHVYCIFAKFINRVGGAPPGSNLFPSRVIRAMCGWLINVFCKEGITGIDKRLKRPFSSISVEALNLTFTIRQLSAIEQTNSLPYCKNSMTMSPVRLCVFNDTSRLMWVLILLRGHKTPSLK